MREEDAVGDAEGDADLEDDPDADGDTAAIGDLAAAGDVDRVTAGVVDGLRYCESDGLTYALGTGTTRGTDDDERGDTDAGDAGDVAVGVVSAAPAFGWACGTRECGTAPVRTKTAAAEAATSPPVIPADATGRERRCRARRPLLPGAWPLRGAPNWTTFPVTPELRRSAAG